jgi:hypothetical protein
MAAKEQADRSFVIVIAAGWGELEQMAAPPSVEHGVEQVDERLTSAARSSSSLPPRGSWGQWVKFERMEPLTWSPPLSLWCPSPAVVCISIRIVIRVVIRVVFASSFALMVVGAVGIGRASRPVEITHRASYHVSSRVFHSVQFGVHSVASV